MASLTKQEKVLIALIPILGLIIVASLIFLFATSEKLTDKNSVQVYFIKSPDKIEDFELYPVRRKVSTESDRLLAALEELIKGPNKKELKQDIFTEVPSETKLLGIENAEDRININLSRDFESGGGSTSMKLRLEQLINTVSASSEGKPVYLLLDGEEIKAIGGEGITVPQPLTGNSINNASEKEVENAQEIYAKEEPIIENVGE